MAHLVRSGGDVPLAFSFDMWQLGMLVYQLASQPWPYARAYWPEPGTPGAYTDDQILQVCPRAAPRTLLDSTRPHRKFQTAT